MDRIIAKIDNQGHKIAFCSDTMNANSILMWEPGMEPKKVSLDFYHSTNALPEKDAIELAESYTKTWGQETQLMQRLPRVMRDRPRFKAARPTSVVSGAASALRRATDSEKEIPVEQIAAKKQKFVMRKTGAIWKIADESGNAAAYATDEHDALQILQDLLGKDSQFMQ